MARNVEFSKHLDIQVSRGIKIDTLPVLAIGRAVAYMAVTVRQVFQQVSNLLSENMFVATSSSVEPPDFPCRTRCGQRMEHRNHGRRTHPGT
ncbi:hypothetical protein X740_10930 [Mesorhizobium sp. LNHC221B00]|nr:hypothetical protein X740_10930 [Mesorhizobium sp. LNHC221B00]